MHELLLTRALAVFGATCFTEAMGRQEPILCLSIHVTSFLEITSLLDRHVHSLSRGENQHIVIARALLSAPRLLVLDEPLTALDVKLKDAILEQLGSLHREFGIPMRDARPEGSDRNL